MKAFFYLSSCDTCKRIMKTLPLPEEVEKIDIKKHPITDQQLEILYKLSGCYEDLFNKRAQLYKQRNLNIQNLQDRDFKALLLEHYTFLKRPVLVYDQTLFVGNSPKTIEAANTFLREQ